MREVWSHRCATPGDEARAGAAYGQSVIVATRPQGSYAETVTTLVALDVTTGEPRWQRTIEPIGSNQAIITDGDLVVVLHQEKPHACGYDASTGAELWRHPLTGEPRGALFVHDEIVIVSGSTIRRIDRGGRLVAKAALRGTELTTLAVTADGDIVTTSGRGAKNILRLHRDTLEIAWATKIAGEGWTYRTAPLVTDDAVLFHSYSLWMMALDVATGELRWRKKKAAGRTGTVFAGPDGSWFRGTESLARIRPSDAKVVWETPNVIAAAPVGTEPDRVVVARREDAAYTHVPNETVPMTLELLDARTGEQIRSTALGGVTKHWVAGDLSTRLFTVVDGFVLSGLEAGWVRAFDLD